MIEHYENKNCDGCEHRENTFCHKYDIHLTDDNKTIIDECSEKELQDNIRHLRMIDGMPDEEVLKR